MKFEHFHRFGRLLAVSLLSVTLAGALAGCGEEEEHPTDGEHPEGSKEHPEGSHEHPEGEKKSEITKEDLAKSIEKYVAKESELKGGYFLVYDEKAGEPLVLTLDKVHKERLSKTAPGVYFACADFEGKDGTMYDLDIFMTGWHKDRLKVTEVSVHKVAGEPRYTWYEEEGTWKKKPVR